MTELAPFWGGCALHSSLKWLVGRNGDGCVLLKVGKCVVLPLCTMLSKFSAIYMKRIHIWKLMSPNSNILPLNTIFNFEGGRVYLHDLTIALAALFHSLMTLRSRMDIRPN